ncbi:MAG: glycerol kinase GlpK [Ilumatobacteraceae bacterium]
MNRCVIALDAGTSSVRARAIFADQRLGPTANREFAQYYPQPGWVEHDAVEIWHAARDVLAEVVNAVGRDRVVTIGITNQRETVVAWERETGSPHGRAIVWQDRRTAARCDELRDAGRLPLVRERTGLVLDPYFSGTKMEWMLTKGGVEIDDTLAIGTIDTWLMWNLTGGEVYATDPTNACRTLLYDINAHRWDDELCSLFGVPPAVLAEIKPSSGRFGVTSDRCGAPPGIPISGVAGDQQAALLGQACFSPGMAKNTFGTGSFVLLNVGGQVPAPAEGMLTSVGWSLADGTYTYVLEGAIFVTGAAVQWLRDGLGVIDAAPDVGPLAESVESTDGVVVVPAFTGLGSPYWDPYARGTIVGISRGTKRAHLARAVVEAMAYQTRDVVDAMVRASGVELADLRVDGGASAMDLLLQILADQLGVPVRRPVDLETTSRGAAFLAGLAEGVWADFDELSQLWELERSFEPAADRQAADALYATWQRAVQRSRNWTTR